MFSYKEACQSSSNAVILPSISDENIDYMQNLFSSRIDEILQETIMELKASTQSPGISQDTNLTETEQAQAGYEEIGETLGPAIPDLPRIMPGYQDSLAHKDCHSEDRENFLCPTSDLQLSDDDCPINGETFHVQENIPACPVAILFPVPQSGSVQTETAEFTPVSITAAEDQHFLNQHALAEEGIVDLTSDMFNSTMETSSMTEQTQSMQLMETASFSEHTGFMGLVHMAVDCQNHDGTTGPRVSAFYHACDSLILCSETLCQDRPGPKPPDLACCYPKKFRFKD